MSVNPSIETGAVGSSGNVEARRFGAVGQLEHCSPSRGRKVAFWLIAGMLSVLLLFHLAFPVNISIVSGA
jgi:hypothetical protein